MSPQRNKAKLWPIPLVCKVAGERKFSLRTDHPKLWRKPTIEINNNKEMIKKVNFVRESGANRQRTDQ